MKFGLFIIFLYGINNVNIAKDMILGMLVGGGVFVIITILGGIVSGKEAMGLGDVKLMGALGIFYGVNSILASTLVAFIIGAVASIVILLVRKFILKSNDEYIPFGPFLVMGALICIFVDSNVVFGTFMNFCQLLSDNIIMLFQ